MRTLILAAAAVLAVPACMPTAVEVERQRVDDVADIWPPARAVIASAATGDLRESLGDWDLAIYGRDARRLRELRDRDWGRLRALVGSSWYVEELGRRLARL